MKTKVITKTVWHRKRNARHEDETSLGTERGVLTGAVCVPADWPQEGCREGRNDE